MEEDTLERYVKDKFYGEYLEGLRESIRIPSLSKVFDKEWSQNGHLYR
jgi:hypothetical protein